MHVLYCTLGSSFCCSFPLCSSRICNPYSHSLNFWVPEILLLITQVSSVQFSSVHSLSHVWLFVTPWTAAHQASLSITNCQSLHKPISIESVMPSNNLILCRSLLLLPSIFPSIRIFSKESALHIRWPKY